MTTLYILRHGEARGNIERYFHGDYNSDLTKNGILQAKAAAEVIKTYPIDVIYSSDLKRAFDTVYESAKLLNLPINTSNKLREINGGDWENVPWDDLPVRFPEVYKNWCDHPHLLEMPKGESMTVFQNRVFNEIENIIKSNKGKNILLATHGTVIKVYLCKIMGFDLSELNKVPWVDNASITVVEINNNMGYNIKIVGEDSHLGELSTLKKQNWWKNTDKER